MKGNSFPFFFSSSVICYILRAILHFKLLKIGNVEQGTYGIDATIKAVYGSLWCHKLHNFGNFGLQKQIRTTLAMYDSRKSHFLAIYGPRNCTILVISGPKMNLILGPEIAKMVDISYIDATYVLLKHL